MNRIEYRADMEPEIAREQESTLNNAQKTSRQLWPALLVYWHIAMAREKSKQ